MHPTAFPIASAALISLLIEPTTTATPISPTTAAMTTKTLTPTINLSTLADPSTTANNITKTFLAGPYTYTLITLALYPSASDLDPACDIALPLLLAEHSDTIFVQLRSRCAIASIPIPSPTSNPGNTSTSAPGTDMRALRYGSWRCGQDRLYVDVLDEEDGAQRCLWRWMEMEGLRVDDEGVVDGGVVVRVPTVVVVVVGLVGAVCVLVGV